MRRTARPLTGTALAVAAPAYGAPAGDVEVEPSAVVPGGQVTVRTAACGDGGSATGDAGAVGAGSLSLAPGPHEQDATGRFRVAPSARPGAYEITATCTGSGRRITGDLVVTPASERPEVRPRGSVKTGVGGAKGPDPVQTAAGAAALTVAAAGGTWLLRRRARGDGI